MKTKIIATIFLVLLNNISNSQEIKNTNYISGEIKVPIIVDQILIEDHFLDDRRDSNTRNENVSFDIYTQLNNIPIYFYGKQTFRGKYIEEVYDLITEINVTGSINSETNLGTITVQQKETKNVKAHPMNVCDYDYEYSFNYEYIDLKVIKGIEFGNQKDKNVSYLFKPNENTKLTVSNYKYIEDTKCSNRNYSKEFVFKNIKEEYLKEKLNSHWSYFTFTIHWNGKTIKDLIKESISITKIRDEDPNWEPPSTPYLREGIKAEPNSIAIYPTSIKIVNVNNPKFKGLEKGFPALLIADLSKVPNLKVLERQKINEILQEIDLSESGLVKEDSKVENNLMKEEMAVIVKLEIDAGKLTFNTKFYVQSKNKEITLSTANLPLKEIFGIQKSLTKLIIEEANNQFNMNTDPEIIFRK
ncbi:hypothetical protein BX611_1802 [Lutibacter oceani]|uniref:Uncharacterized protein n=1 Tax=Lutibacter oceani TaxID=1853311 RepID=A0A3D9RYP7_9FLAO|nr:CsgG/HfaB family protein [Lutibacter oceani]REE82256.1 hypothetical protein BX611_1802 [Lutibacter oceani]